MNQLLKLTYLSHIKFKKHDGISFIDNIETHYLDKLTKIYGYITAVRILDYIMIITTILFSLILAFMMFAFLLRNNPVFTIRFSDKLEGFIYMWAERKGIKEVVIKRPKNYQDRIEVLIALLWIRFLDHVPLREQRAKRLSATIIVIFLLMLLLMFVFLLFAHNVVTPELQESIRK